MGKQPAFQFYPGDWTRDMDDYDLETEGAWIRIICRLWWAEKRGETTKPLKEWARILRKTEQKTLKIFQILIEKRIASGSILDNQNITIISRRMVRDEKLSLMRRQVGSLGGNPNLIKTKNILDNQTDNQKPTPSSSNLHTSSSTSKKTTIELPEGVKKETWDAFIEMRKIMKAPLSVYATKLIIANLIKLSNNNGDGMNLILEQSIANNWKGVFALKENYGTGTFGRTGTPVKKAGRAESDGKPYPVDHEFS